MISFFSFTKTLCVCAWICGSLYGLEEIEHLSKIRYQLIIQDSKGALTQSRQALEEYPHSREIQKAYLQTLCNLGKESEAIEAGRLLVDFSANSEETRSILETIAWGALSKGQDSSQFVVRLSALLGAVFTHDARSISLLLRELKSSSAILRNVAIKLSMQMGDRPLRKEILRFLQEEKIWYVRLSAIEAARSLKMIEAKPILEKIICKEKTSVEERGAAIIALASLYDSISKEVLEGLIKSKRSGLRHLACQLVMHVEGKEHAALLLPLLSDSSPEVRVAALSALTLCEIKEEEKIFPLLEDINPSVAITAAWALLRQGSAQGERRLELFLLGENLLARRLAASAVAFSGPFGTALSKKYIHISKDPYVRINLALGLIRCKEEVEVSSATIADILSLKQEELWMWDKGTHPIFEYLAPSTISHVEHIPNYPVLVDRLTRMDLLGVLSIVHYPKALDSMRMLLKMGQIELVGPAAGILIQEMEEEGVLALKALLDDKEEEVRIEAALILALWGRDSSGISVLMNAYKEASRERKLQILEALGRSGDLKAVSFLFEVLAEPFQVLRIVAAAALIQCLYH